MDESIQTILQDTFCHVVEQQAFMFPEPAKFDLLIPSGSRYLAGSIGFSGDASGSVLLLLPETTAKEMAGNFLGMDEDDVFVERNFRDALKELLNVVCGHFLTARYGEEAEFDLTIPAVASASASETVSIAEHPQTLAFQIDDARIWMLADLGAPSGEAP